MSRVVIAEDHAISRRGLTLMISEGDGPTVLGASSSAELMRLLRSDRVDAVVMSSSFEKDGTEIVRRIRSQFPRLPILVFNNQPDDLVAIRILRAGASGYLQKKSPPEELMLALRHLMSGGTYINAVIAEMLASELIRGGEGKKPHERLSPREIEVFYLLASGKTVSEAARKLKLSVKTVSTHRTHILEKTGLRNSLDIIRYAILNSMI